MLVFPQWRPEVRDSACRVQRWMPAERFAPYLARPVVMPARPPLQVCIEYEDEDSSGGSSPERSDKEGVCGWRGCGANLPSVARLSAHVARTHALAHDDGMFYCSWRGCTRPHKGFNARYKMLVHVRTHTNERPHTCNQCDKSFSRAENLKIHLRSHSGEKPYVCPYEGCGKAYSNSSDRFKHTRTHTVDKPYCCKVAGCNKRYTDPSSLRKHVKTYKHFVTEEFKRESSDDNTSFSPTRKSESSYTNIESTSPLRYNPPQTLSPTIPPYNPVLPMREPSVSLGYTPMIDRVTYVGPLEPLYPMRVPANEMSYVEYTQMYEHAYNNYYSNNINYPVLRPIIDEKNYRYEQTRIEDETIDIEHTDQYEMEPQERFTEEMPLNLICSKRLECRPIEELVKRTDLPLDLSTKS